MFGFNAKIGIGVKSLRANRGECRKDERREGCRKCLILLLLRNITSRMKIAEALSSKRKMLLF